MALVCSLIIQLAGTTLTISIVMGDIPSQNNMVSTVILSPQNLQDLTPNQSFNVSLQVANLQAGAFTNATSTYYAAPQTLNSAGKIIGHVHVTIQDVGSLNPSTPPDASTFAFFKGIDDAGNGQGLLQAAVTGGLAAGTYRVCTMSSSSNHQPVLMPVSILPSCLESCLELVLMLLGCQTRCTR
jgi:transcription initiation factor TFIID subunit 15